MMTANEKNIMQKSQRLSRWNAQKLFYSVGNAFKRTKPVKRGEVYFVNLGENIGSEENKIRPVVVLQSNAYNFSSPVFTAAIVSSSKVTINDIQIPIVGTYSYTENGTTKSLKGAVDLGQIKTIAKERIVSGKICTLSSEMNQINEKLLNALGLHDILKSRDNTIKSLEGKVDYLRKCIEKND